MPLTPEDILKFLDNESEAKFKSELLDLLRKRIDNLCIDECERDRIQCTLTPLCSRRFLLKLRIKNDLKYEDLPKFCYSVHKGVIERFFRNKTVVYRPYDAFLYKEHALGYLENDNRKYDLLFMRYEALSEFGISPLISFWSLDVNPTVYKFRKRKSDWKNESDEIKELLEKKYGDIMRWYESLPLVKEYNRK